MSFDRLIADEMQLAKPTATSCVRESDQEPVPKLQKLDERAELCSPASPSLPPRMQSLK